MSGEVGLETSVTPSFGRPLLAVGLAMAMLIAGCRGGTRPSSAPSASAQKDVPQPISGRAQQTPTLPKPEPDAPAPLAIPSAEEAVLVGFLHPAIPGSVSLLGWWGPKTGWQRWYAAGDLQAGEKLFRPGAVWTLYNLSCPGFPVEVTTEQPHADDYGDGTSLSAKIKRLPARGCRQWLAVSSPKRLARGRVRSVPATGDATTSAIRRVLRDRGIWETPARIVQNLAADLNHDGREERLLSVTFGEGERSQRMVFGAYRNASEGLEVAEIPGARKMSLLGRSWVDVVAVVDIDGDGRREVAVNLPMDEYSGFEVYRFDDTGFHVVLDYGWGP